MVSVIVYSPHGVTERMLIPAGEYFINNSDSDSTELIPVAIAVNFNTPVSVIVDRDVKIFNSIFEMVNAVGQAELIDIINAIPTITREEFINLVKQ